MPPLVRRQTFGQRLLAFFNPLDRLLGIATDLEAFDWDSWSAVYGAPAGIALNLLCLIARVNSSSQRRHGAEEVFRRPTSSSWGGVAYLVCSTAGLDPQGRNGDFLACRSLNDEAGSLFALPHQLYLFSLVLALFSVGNAIYCFSRKRRYRLFEQNIEVEPATPSARRVRVDSTPVSGSPMSFLSSLMDPITSAASRAHPDATRDVWEVAVWDPALLSLDIFAFFSPAHVAVYFLSLPISNSAVPNSPIASGTPNTSSVGILFTAIATQILMTFQIYHMQSAYRQQAQDHKVIHKEVLNEYDAKYVHPRLNVLKRDVAIQCTPREDAVNVYTPTFDRQGFRTAPNPNYSSYTTSATMPRAPSSYGSTPDLGPRASTPFTAGRIRQPQFGSVSNARRTVSASTGMDDHRHQREEDQEMDRDRSLSLTGRRRRESGFSATLPRNTNVGTNAIVNWSLANSRNLSPRKSSTPLRGSSTARGSTYAESLGTPLGTPIRRRDI